MPRYRVYKSREFLDVYAPTLGEQLLDLIVIGTFEEQVCDEPACRIPKRTSHLCERADEPWPGDSDSDVIRSDTHRQNCTSIRHAVCPLPIVGS